MSTSWWVMVENGQTVLQSHTWIIHPIQRLWAISGVLDSNIYKNLFISAKREKTGPNLTRQLCFWKEMIYQKWGAIYANPACVVSLPTNLICNCSQRSITASKIDTLRAEASAISVSTAGEIIRHSWVFASIPLFREGWTAWTNMGD